MMNVVNDELIVKGFEKDLVWALPTNDIFQHACGGSFFFLFHLLGQNCFPLFHVSLLDLGPTIQRYNTHSTLRLNTHTDHSIQKHVKKSHPSKRDYYIFLVFIMNLGGGGQETVGLIA